MKRAPMTRTWFVGGLCATLGLGLAAFAPACSGLNRSGPDVTCADLLCGKVNACQDGIIAQCFDGEHVKFHACGSDKNLCTLDWQVPGQYRCEAAATACEGCRPEPEFLGCGDGSGGGGSGGTGGTGTGGTAAGGGGSSAGGGGSSAGGGGSSAGGGSGGA
ncbi:MAG: hypothetical protein IT373_09835 [Polyangiaceae bacterium]|nr:hypothetical protein [Polyangiaceae bacterium]